METRSEPLLRETLKRRTRGRDQGRGGARSAETRKVPLVLVASVLSVGTVSQREDRTPPALHVHTTPVRAEAELVMPGIRRTGADDDRPAVPAVHVGRVGPAVEVLVAIPGSRDDDDTGIGSDLDDIPDCDIQLCGTDTSSAAGGLRFQLRHLRCDMASVCDQMCIIYDEWYAQ